MTKRILIPIKPKGIVYISFNPFSSGTVFIRQNLKSVDVKFWHMKMVPTLKKWNYL